MLEELDNSDMHAARAALEIIRVAEKTWALGGEVLLAALDELDIPPSKFYSAVCAGEAEWIK